MANQEDKFSNRQISHLLRSVAFAYILKNENRFKIIAYERAADEVGRFNRELKNLWKENKLHYVPGIGHSISQHLNEYFRTGRSKHFDEVLKGIPETVFELTKVPTIGPKRAFKLVKALKLFDPKTIFSDLKKAGQENIIASLPTFGHRSQEEILEAIATYEKRSIKEERMPLAYAYEIASHVVDYLKKNGKIKRVDVLGSLRRMVSTIGDIDIAVSTNQSDVDSIIDYFIHYPDKISVDNAGGKKASIIVPPYVRVDLRVQDEKTYGSMLQYFTGSKSHNIELREYALRKGYSLSEYGIMKIKNKISNIKKANKKSKIFHFKNEEEFYNFLGLQYIPPEIREGTNEIILAEKDQLPKLVELKDIKGDLHMHSSYDIKTSHDIGANTYNEMLDKAIALNYQYIGFTDHNPKISNHSEDEIIAIMKARKTYIDKIISLKKVERCKYFIGIETDILPDGTIALPNAAIDYVDYLIVSVHSSFQKDVKEMTDRVIKSFNYPKVRIFGHPTGRLLPNRDGYNLEWERVFEACRKKEIALEINAWPERLDLPDNIAKEAIVNGIKLSIDTDSHSVEHMDNMFYGASVARRAWAKKSDIINSLDYQAFKKWLLG